MWNIVVVTVMAALVGIYMLPSERNLSSARDMQAREMADSMGVYRQAVVRYFTATGKPEGSASMDELKSGGYLPEWSRLYAQGNDAPWDNYRNVEGIIYIYPKALPEINIVPDLLTLAHNSVTVTVYRAADKTLYSPGDNQRFPHNLGGRPIPDGAPVWMAASN